jgi:serine/threonine protein kinase
VLFEMLTGQPPFMAESLTELLRAHLVQPVPRIAELRPELVDPEPLQRILDRALAKQAEARFADAGEMLRELLAVTIGELSIIDEAVTGRISSPPRPREPGPRTQRARLRTAHAAAALQAAATAQAARPITRERSSGGWVLWLLAATLCAVIGWLLR